MKKIVLYFGAFLMILGGSVGGGAAVSSGAVQSQAGGGVTLKLTYVNPGSSEGPRFNVVLDTHSVNLDQYDLKALTLLRDSTGRNYEPSKVENKSSGHHREALVIFPKPAGDAKWVEVVFKDIAGVKERTFRWNVE